MKRSTWILQILLVIGRSINAPDLCSINGGPSQNIVNNFLFLLIVYTCYNKYYHIEVRIEHLLTFSSLIFSLINKSKT
jgi:hypothetical protein